MTHQFKHSTREGVTPVNPAFFPLTLCWISAFYLWVLSFTCSSAFHGPILQFVQVLTDAQRGKSPKPLKSAAIDVKSKVITNGLCSPFYSAAIDLKSLPFSNGLASPFYYNRSGHDEVDLDYLAYEFQVAQAHLQYHEKNVAHGGWNNLKFWKRIPKENGMRLYGGSAAPTPLHPTYITGPYQPSTPGPTHHRSRHGTWGPLYSDDVSKLPAHYRSKRSCSSPITSLKVIMPHKDDCNMSPYVPLNRAQRLASGPLYLV